jgi:hypothetical protein
MSGRRKRRVGRPDDGTMGILVTQPAVHVIAL